MVVVPRRRCAVRRSLVLVLAGLLACAPSPGPAAAASPAAEYELKAAFLFNFAKFVEWPDGAFADSHPAICIGVVGIDPFGAILDRMLRDKIVHDERIEIRRFATLADVGSCHVVFVSAATERQLGRTTYGRDGVLTVGESSDFLDSGGIIAFGMEENKLRFEINAAAAERAHLKISSQLLKLAVRVRSEAE